MQKKTIKKKPVKIDVKKIGSFLKSINGAEYLYIQHCISVRNGIQSLIEKHNLSKEDICSRFKIKPEKYIDFIKGNYNYSVIDISVLNALFMEIEIENLKDRVPVQFAKGAQ